MVWAHDTKALIAHYEKMQENYADRIVAEPSAVYTPSEIEHGLTPCLATDVASASPMKAMLGSSR